jgi:hypothetical protein
VPTEDPIFTVNHTHTAIVQLSADTLLYRFGRRREGESSIQLARDKKHNVDIGEVSDLAAQTTRALACSDLANLQRLGELLYNKVIPNKVATYLSLQPPSSNLVFDLDPEIFQIPWELLYDGTEFLCRRFRVSRLLVKSGEELEVAMRRDVLTGPGRVLVLRGDVHGLDYEHEEESIQRILLPAVGSDNFVIRSAENKDEAIGLLTEGYDICHFIGHGEFSKQHREDSGWKFPKGKVLTCSEIEQITSPAAIFPRLIVANSCDSARSGDTGPEAYVSALYHSFLSRGVQHYIGTIGRVPDHVSQVFSQSFYEGFASGRSIGEALFAAREVTSTGIGWAFYVHYGDPGFSPLASISRSGPLTQSTSEPRAFETIVAQRRQTAGVHVRRSREIHLARYQFGIFAPDYSGAILLAGEAGIGKSECLTDILNELMWSAPNAICGLTACTKASKKREYAPIKDLLLSLLSSNASVASINDRVIAVVRQYPQLSSLARLDLLRPQMAKTRATLQLPTIVGIDPELLLRELRSLITDLSSTHPVIIAIEDLQWADELSLDILFELFVTCSTRRTIFLGTYRQHDIPTSLNTRLTDARVRGVNWLGLDCVHTVFFYDDEPMPKPNRVRDTEAFVVRYLAKALSMSASNERPSCNLVRSLIRYTGGNSLLLSEVVREIRAKGYLISVPGRFCQIWELRQSVDTLMTPRMLAWARERVDLLDHVTKRILMHASVVGFNIKTLGELVQTDPITVSRSLEQLETVHRLLNRWSGYTDSRRNVNPNGPYEEGDVRGFYIRHGVVRRYCENLLEKQKYRLHSLFGEYLIEVHDTMRSKMLIDYYKTIGKRKELSYGGLGLESIGKHFLEGGRYEEALRYSLDAASDYTEQGRVTDAIRNYRRALELWNRFKRIRVAEDVGPTIEPALAKVLPFEWQDRKYDYYGFGRREQDRQKAVAVNHKRLAVATK